jgi:hypothetical protein
MEMVGLTVGTAETEPVCRGGKVWRKGIRCQWISPLPS